MIGFQVRINALIRLLNGLETVTSGHIYINDKDITTLKNAKQQKEQNHDLPTVPIFYGQNSRRKHCFFAKLQAFPKAERKS